MTDLRQLMERADRVVGRIEPGDDALERLARHREQRRRRQRRASMVVALALMALALAVISPLVRVGQELSPGDIGPFEEMPPFRATVEGTIPQEGVLDPAGPFTVELLYRDASAWRLDVREGHLPSVAGHPLSAGSFAVYDGDVVRLYDAGEDLVYRQGVVQGFSPLNLLGWEDPKAPWQRFCLDGTVVGSDSVAGRGAVHLRCPAAGSFGDELDVWVDSSTGLVLRIASHGSGGDPTSVSGPIIFVPQQTVSIASVDYDPDLGEDAFRFTAPPGAKTAEEVEAQAPATSLVIGEQVPMWTAPTLDGGELDLASLRGQAVLLYFWADWCPPCTGQPLDAFQAARDSLGDGVELVSVAYVADRSQVQGLVGEEGYRFSVALADEAIGDSWGIEGIPLLVALDDEGRLAGAYLGFEGLSEEDLAKVADALVTGQPLPHIEGVTKEQIG